MKSILIDAGPIIALFRKKDRYYDKALEFIKSCNSNIVTTWVVVTEVMYELQRPDVQEKFIIWIGRGGLDIADMAKDSLPAILDLIRKYSDVPMDFADATLILHAQKTGIEEIATIDSDFNIYRTVRDKYLKNVFLGS